MELLTFGIIAGAVAANNTQAANELLKKKKFVVEHIINKKKDKGDNHMYDVAISLMGRDVKVLTIMGVVPGRVTEVTDSSVTLMHKHYKQIVNMDYIITITEKILD